MKTLIQESKRNISTPFLLMVIVLLVLVPFFPANTFAWSGDAHGWSVEQAAHLFIPENHDKISDQIPHSPNTIARMTRTPIFPELSYGLSKAWYEGDVPGEY